MILLELLAFEIDLNTRMQVDVLKELTWYYIIDSPDMVCIRKAERSILEKIFYIYADIVENLKRRTKVLVPQQIQDRRKSGERVLRLVADLLAGMTER